MDFFMENYTFMMDMAMLSLYNAQEEAVVLPISFPNGLTKLYGYY